MKQLELYGRVRYAVIIQGMSHRKAARMFGIDRRTVDKMVAFPEPPGYRRKKIPTRPKLDPYVGIIDQILEDDTKRLKKHGTPRSGYLSAFVMSTASPVASPS